MPTPNEKKVGFCGSYELREESVTLQIPMDMVAFLVTYCCNGMFILEYKW